MSQSHPSNPLLKPPSEIITLTLLLFSPTVLKCPQNWKSQITHPNPFSPTSFPSPNLLRTLYTQIITYNNFSEINHFTLQRRSILKSIDK
ncbi:hypothetical protein DID88_001184 [Monilinia fructigena]|uniref:Uncharacterized protein n=1 Tax=Monilinia fructigena TaxID=38457 RepID=A0A395IXS0_9HELO|nr:hypothetical protein DID88_001184 [Monilinia fructigena]